MPPERKERAKRTASDSGPQRTAEKSALRNLARKLRIADLLSNHRIEVGSGWVSVDGFHEDDDEVVLLEVNARIGYMKQATRNKVLKDAFKMLVISKAKSYAWRGKRVRRILVFLSDEARQSFGPRSWAHAAFDAMGIEAVVCRVSAKQRAALEAAQRRQDLRFTLKK